MRRSRGLALATAVLLAAAGGTWTLTLRVPGGNEAWTLALRQTFQRVTGTLAAGVLRWPLTDATLDGDALAFAAGPWRFTGRVDGDGATGRAVDEAGAAREWTARRSAR